jgi:hypothetical protein
MRLYIRRHMLYGRLLFGPVLPARLLSQLDGPGLPLLVDENGGGVVSK